MSELEVLTEEKAVAEVRKILATHTLPPELQDVRVEPGYDWTGDAAVWLHFDLKPGPEPDDVTLSRLSSFMTEVQDAVLRSGIQRFPYAYLHEAAA